MEKRYSFGENMSVNTVTVTIAGREFSLNSTDSPESVQRTAALVDRKMREAAAAGIFVLGTLHTKGAAETAMRVESMFSIDQRDSVRDLFSDVFIGIFSQQLIKKIGGGRVSATEVLLATAASRNLIRQGKYIQLASTMMSGKSLGMQTMETALQKLIDSKIINKITNA